MIQAGRAIVMSNDVVAISIAHTEVSDFTSRRTGNVSAWDPAMSNCTSYLAEPPTLSSLLWIAVGVGALCLVLTGVVE